MEGQSHGRLPRFYRSWKWKERTGGQWEPEEIFMNSLAVAARAVEIPWVRVGQMLLHPSHVSGSRWASVESFQWTPLTTHNCPSYPHGSWGTNMPQASLSPAKHSCPLGTSMPQPGRLVEVIHIKSSSFHSRWKVTFIQKQFRLIITFQEF